MQMSLAKVSCEKLLEKQCRVSARANNLPYSFSLSICISRLPRLERLRARRAPRVKTTPGQVPIKAKCESRARPFHLTTLRRHSRRASALECKLRLDGATAAPQILVGFRHLLQPKQMESGLLSCDFSAHYSLLAARPLQIRQARTRTISIKNFLFF